MPQSHSHWQYVFHFSVRSSFAQRCDNRRRRKLRWIFHRAVQCPRLQRPIVWNKHARITTRSPSIQCAPMSFTYRLMPSSSLATLNAWFKFSIFRPGINFGYSNRSGRCEWINALNPKPERHDDVKSYGNRNSRVNRTPASTTCYRARFGGTYVYRNVLIAVCFALTPQQECVFCWTFFRWFIVLVLIENQNWINCDGIRVSFELTPGNCTNERRRESDRHLYASTEHVAR